MSRLPSTATTVGRSVRAPRRASAGRSPARAGRIVTVPPSAASAPGGDGAVVPDMVIVDPPYPGATPQGPRRPAAWQRSGPNWATGADLPAAPEVPYEE